MRIALDAMSGDKGLKNNVEGALMALENNDDIEIVLVGKKQEIEEILQEYKYDKEKITIVNADDIIDNNEDPVRAIRNKKDSTIVKGLNLLKENKVNSFVSSGSTGALLSGGVLIVRRIKGIDRPAIGSVYPTENGVSFLLDIGANSDCKPKNLLQFGMMGSIYSKEELKIENPKVGIVNIGTEENKGNDLTKKAFELLKDSTNINFIGNVEARDIPKGEYDVLISDGFTGNIILKLSEGLLESTFNMLKKELTSTTIGKIGGFMIKDSFKRMKKNVDYSEYGGAALLGVKGSIIKAHGSSNETAIKNAIEQGRRFVKNEILEKIEENIGLLGGEDDEGI